MQLSLLKCPACGAEIVAEQVDAALGIARCASCSRVMRLGVPKVEARAQVAVPSHFTVDDAGDGLEIGWRWFRPKHVMMAFFCVAWDAFLLFWYRGALGSAQANWLAIVFPVAHVAVGVSLTYSTLAGFLNRTRITTLGRALAIRHGPLPWSGNRTLEAGAIDQLYCVSKESRGENSISYTYTVRAELKDGRQLDLITGLDEAGQALFLEQQLERRLDIADRPVPGELPR